MSEDSVKDAKITELLNRTNEMLTLLNNDNIPKLQEQIFVGVFIPVFAGEESLYGATIDTWIKFTGSPYKEVDVIDNKGNTLFRVPPIYDRNTVNSISDSKKPIGHIITTAQQFSRIHPNQGIAYLENELNKKAMLIKIPSNILNNLEFWNMVFKRYGREPIMELIKTKEIAVLNKTNPDDFESF